MDHVQIFDTTLRDGEQSPGISLNATEKLEIAHQLARLERRHHRGRLPDRLARATSRPCRRSRARSHGPVIAGLARAHAGGHRSRLGGRQGRRATRASTRSSPRRDIHIEHQLQSTREDVKGQARAGGRAARRRSCEDVEFSPMDATRADVEFTAEVIQIAIDEGATTINIPDTVGYAMPDEYAAFLDATCTSWCPALRDVVLSVHCHDDLGLAVANSFAGVQAGARQVECAINGIGERAGNASLEEIVMLLHTRRRDIGLDTRHQHARDRAHEPPGRRA